MTQTTILSRLVFVQNDFFEGCYILYRSVMLCQYMNRLGLTTTVRITIKFFGGLLFSMSVSGQYSCCLSVCGNFRYNHVDPILVDLICGYLSSVCCEHVCLMLTCVVKSVPKFELFLHVLMLI